MNDQDLLLRFALLVLLAPLVGFCLLSLLGGRLPKGLVGLVACLTPLVSFAFSAYLLAIQLGSTGEAALSPGGVLLDKNVYTWIGVGTLEIPFGIRIDPLSLVMMAVVSGVGSIIHIYSIGYMGKDARYSRYFSQLNLFTFSMLLLVMANNFAVLFVGWELVGLCSYLLIGFWFERDLAAKAGQKAFIVNRIGDLGFLLGVILIFHVFGTLNFSSVFESAESKLVGTALATAIPLLLFVGAVGKSAQVPLYVWLPDAMEGPTPVSALIHAATMVTAGVYMVARCYTLYVLSPVAMAVVASVGLVTAVYAASISLVQNDIKRILAYSTVSQLGYMFLGAGVGAFAAGIFHLVTHAFFKALLFLCAGSVIHSLSNEQDIRKMGGLFPKMRITGLTFWIGGLALAGIWPLSGFFSKDEILWHAYKEGGVILWLVAVVGVAMTAFYILRLLLKVFHGETRLAPETQAHAHESPLVMTIPLLLLAILSAGAGILSGRIESFLAPAVGVLSEPMTTGMAQQESFLKAVSLLAAGFGILLAFYFYRWNPEAPAALRRRASGLYALVLNKYGIDELYETLLVNPGKRLAAMVAEIFDLRIIDGIVNGLAFTVAGFGSLIRRWQAGYIRGYAFAIFVGAILILIYYFVLHPVNYDLRLP